ncbi:MAG TPA: YhfC family glutamic-type intramembrane protease [Roseiflexaceae bacterium]|nr:YhfC family glutamic-type intramembrane protease [Roseiflexaceae bacterium]
MNVIHSSLLTTGDLAPAAVPPLALLGGIGMILVALGFAAYAGLRQLGWGALGLGALAWGVTVALKFAWAIPFNPPIYTAINQALPSLGVPLFALYVGALTGIFEVGLVALLLNYTRLGKAAWPRTIAFGIGFGAIEALLLGVSSLSSMLVAMVISMALPPAPSEVLARLDNILWVLAPVVERLAAIFIHICSTVLIFYAVNTRQVRYLWLAFGYKTAIDAVAAAFVQINGVDSLGRVWTFETILILFGVASWLGLRSLAPRYQALPIEEPTAREPRLAHGAG